MELSILHEMIIEIEGDYYPSVQAALNREEQIEEISFYAFFKINNKRYPIPTDLYDQIEIKVLEAMRDKAKDIYNERKVLNLENNRD